MKRFFLITSIIIILILAGSIYFLRSSSDYRSIYFVPSDAVLILETQDPFNAWDKIVHSESWEHYSTNTFFKELNNDILSYDSLVNSSKIIYKLAGKKSVMLSQHPTGNGKYDLLVIVEMGKLAKTKNPEKLLKSVLGKNIEITTREYNNDKILELFDTQSSKYYFLAISRGKVIFSLNPKLLERSLDESSKMVFGRDTKYLDVNAKTGNKGLFSVYLIHENFLTYPNILSPESRKNFQNYTKGIVYTGLYFDINDDGLITIEGFSSFADTVPLTYLGLLKEGNLELKSESVIPKRVASLIKINFDDAGKYFLDAMKTLSNEEYADYIDGVAKIEKRLNINIEKNLFSWMKDEIVLLQTQPSNLGRNNEFVVILHAKNGKDAEENLQFIWKQIRKNTPVKIKSLDYNGYKIDYVAFPGLLKALFGKMIAKIDKPYFTQIEDNVIISNHPQTLKNIIDDYLNKKTFSTSIDYSDFIKLYQKNTSVFLYFEPPVLYQNIKAFVSSQTWNKLQANKKYITCMPQAGLQFNRQDDLLHLTLKAQYRKEIEEWKIQIYNPDELINQFTFDELDVLESVVERAANEELNDSIPEFFISDLDANKYEEFYEDGAVKLNVDVKNGLKHGDFKFFYPDGTIKIRGEFKDDNPVGRWRYYDENGELIKTNKYD